MLTLPAELFPLMVEFAPLFSKPVWVHAKVLVVSAILAPGKRTGTACLRVMGLSQERGFRQRSYWIPGSSAFTDFEHRSTFLMPLKNKGLKEERVAKVWVDHLDKSTTLESNKSLICYASSPTRGFMHQSPCARKRVFNRATPSHHSVEGIPGGISSLTACRAWAREW